LENILQSGLKHLGLNIYQFVHFKGSLFKIITNALFKITLFI
jgi:hypothetical protein